MEILQRAADGEIAAEGKNGEWTCEGKLNAAEAASKGDVFCTLQQSVYVSTRLSAFRRMKLGGTAEE